MEFINISQDVEFITSDRELDSSMIGIQMKFKGGHSFGQPGFSPGLLLHDFVEHCYEMTNIFQTEELAIEGEAFSMGIRASLLYSNEFYDLFRKYFPNAGTFRDVDHDCLRNALFAYDADGDDEEERVSQYEFSGSFKGLDEWKKDPEYMLSTDAAKREFLQYNDESVWKESVVEAFNYGYWFSERYLVDTQQGENIRKFVTNLIQFFEGISEIEGLDLSDPYANCPYGFRWSASGKYEIKKDVVKFTFDCFDREIVISSNQGEDYIARLLAWYSNQYYG